MRGLAIGTAGALLVATSGHGGHGNANRFLTPHAFGILFAILSAIANGTFTVFSKIDFVKRAAVDPLLFTFWACVGIVGSSLVSLVRVRFIWTPQGLLSGIFFALSTANAFRAVKLIGMSVGTGIWCGTAIIVSFIGGLIVDPKGGVNNLMLAILAILLVLVGIGGVTWAGHVGCESSGIEENIALLISQKRAGGRGVKKLSQGVIAALITGVLGGLIMMPMTQSPPAIQGLSYLPSFAIGVAIFAPVVTAIPYLSTQECPRMELRMGALPGIVSGIVWNIGNILSMLAIGIIGYTIAYPILYCGIFIAGLWGMFLFNEIRGNAAALYWGSGFLILTGIILLSFAR